MNTKDGEHDDSADPLTDSTLQDDSGQDSLQQNGSPVRQKLGEQEKQTARRKAEALVRVKEATTEYALNLEEARRLLHELQVHQIEMEIQNEELRRTQVELEASRAQYLDLYDLAPVGYLTLNEEGLILKANLTAATMLGVARGALVQRLLTGFVHHEDQDIYYQHRKQAFETGASQTCELRMLRADAAPFWVLLESVEAQSDDRSLFFRVTINDISAQKIAEEALQKNLTLYSRLIETTNTGFVILNNLGNVVDANQEYVHLSGHENLSQMSLPHKPLSSYRHDPFSVHVHPQARHRCSPQMSHSSSPGVDCPDQIRIHHQEMTIPTYSCLSYPIYPSSSTS